MRLLISIIMLMTACSTVYADEISGKDAENILTKGKILYVEEGNAGGHDFTVLFSKKLYWCTHLPRYITCYKAVSSKQKSKYGWGGN